MGSQAQTIGTVNKSISGNTGHIPVCLTKTTVNYDHLAITFHRILSLQLMNRHVTIDNMPLIRIQPEFFQHTIYYLFFFPEVIVGILFLFVCLFICDKITLEGSHFIFSIKGRIRPGPDIPQNILACFLLLLIYGKKSFSYVGFQFIIKCLAFTSLTVNLNLFQSSIFVQRNTSMEKKVPVIGLIKAAFIQKQLHVVLKLLAVPKC